MGSGGYDTETRNQGSWLLKCTCLDQVEVAQCRGICTELGFMIAGGRWCMIYHDAHVLETVRQRSVQVKGSL